MRVLPSGKVTYLLRIKYWAQWVWVAQLRTSFTSLVSLVAIAELALDAVVGNAASNESDKVRCLHAATVCDFEVFCAAHPAMPRVSLSYEAALLIGSRIS